LYLKIYLVKVFNKKYLINSINKREVSMPKASEIKKNAAIEHNGKVLLVKDINKLTPSGRAGASLYRMRLYDVATGGKVDESFKADEMINIADFRRHQVTFSYIDGDIRLTTWIKTLSATS
jgi:translation elongation factor P/translation initiation factor 5A